MKLSPYYAVSLGLIVALSGCHEPEHHHEEAHKIVVTSPLVKDVTTTQSYVCQIRSRRHIEVRALEGGYLQEVKIKEGQSVKEGDLIFKILPTLYQAKLDAEIAEADLAQIEFNNAKKLYEQHVVSPQEVALAQAKLDKAKAQVQLAQAELNFTDVKAPFDGIVDRLHEQQGSLIEERDILTTLSDNAVMWVYFNVPEARYLEYKAEMAEGTAPAQVELVLANGQQFHEPGVIGAIEADFNNMTGNIAFRADFPNPSGVLRYGQTGTILLKRVEKDAVVIPQRATFEILAKRYAYIVGDDGVVHQREIEVKNEMEDIYVMKEGINPGDKIVLEGIRQVRDGEKVEFEFIPPEEALSQLKYKAE